MATGGKTAAAVGVTALAPAVLAAKSPNETIGVGCIGLGTRGGDLIKAVTFVDGVKVVAVCDVYKPHLQKGVERSQNPDVKTYVDYRELLADKNVDAVVIATPDHWHSPDGARRRQGRQRHLLREGLGPHRGRGQADARRRSSRAGTVFQLGHQARQATCALQAKELIARGLLGPITLVRTGRYGNLPPGQAIWRWYGYYNQFERPDPAQVAARRRLEALARPGAEIPFNERHFWHWRCYWNYGTGQAGDLLSHELDFVQYLLGYGIPDTCIVRRPERPAQGRPRSARHLERRLPVREDRLHRHLHRQHEHQRRPAGRNLRQGSHAAIRRHRPRRQLASPSSGSRSTSGRPAQGLPARQDAGAAQPPGGLLQLRAQPRQPKCHVDEAFIETATYCMSVESYNRRRQVRWDPAKEEIV